MEGVDSRQLAPQVSPASFAASLYYLSDRDISIHMYILARKPFSIKHQQVQSPPPLMKSKLGIIAMCSTRVSSSLEKNGCYSQVPNRFYLSIAGSARLFPVKCLLIGKLRYICECVYTWICSFISTLISEEDFILSQGFDK